MTNLTPFFPKNPSSETRNPEHYHVNMAFTERYKESSIPFMQRLLNHREEEEKLNNIQN